MNNSSIPTFVKRTGLPVLVTVAAATSAALVYFNSGSIENTTIRDIMALVSGIIYFVSVALGPLFVYTATYVRGSSLSERILASFFTPFLWMTKEVLLLLQSHPFNECLYWYLSPLNIWLVMFMGLQFGAGTLIGRFILKKRGSSTRVITAGPLAVMIISLSLVISAYAWGKGENLYVIFLEGYRMIFGYGTGY